MGAGLRATASPTEARAASRQLLAHTWVRASRVGDWQPPPLASVRLSTRERLIALRFLHGHAQRVGHRPNRVEPRAVKRRPSPLALLTELRSAAQARLIGGQKM